MDPAALATLPARRRRLLTAFLVMLCAASPLGVGAARAAPGQPGVVVLVFDGPAGARASTAIGRALSGVRLISAAAYRRTAARLGAAQASRLLGVAAIVRGSITTHSEGRLLLVELVSATNSRRLLRLKLPLESPGVDEASAARVAARLGTALRQAGARGGGAALSAASAQGRRRRADGGATTRAASATGPAGGTTGSGTTRDAEHGASDDADALAGESEFEPGDADVAIIDPATRSSSPARALSNSGPQRRSDDGTTLGYAVGTGRGARADGNANTTAAERHQQERAAQARAAGERIYLPFELGAGVLMLGRGFRFLQPINPPRPATLGTPALVPALHLSAALQPLALGTQGPAAGLGLTLRFWRSVGTRATLPETPEQPFAVTLQTTEIGLRYYWSLLGRPDSAALLLRLAFGHQLASATPSGEAADPTQDVAYSYLRPGVGLRWPFVVAGRFELGATVGLDYLAVLTAGAIEQPDSSGYGSAAILAFDGSLGMFIAYAGVFARVEGSYRRFELAFDRSCTTRRTGCRQAVGARDIYAGAALELGYAF